MGALKRRLVYLMASGLALTLALGLLVANYSAVLKHYQNYCSSYEVWGTVSDVGSGLPVEGVKVTSLDNHTYTDWEGKFYLSGLGENESVNLILPEGYEPYQTPAVKYQDYGQRLLCQRVIRGSFSPLPGPHLVLQRLLREEAHQNFDYLWSFMTQEGQGLWDSKMATNKVMSGKSQILDKLGSATTSYEISPVEEAEDLETWIYPLTGRRYKNVRQFKVTKQKANGEEIVELWYLIREAGSWRYFPAESKGLVDTFIRKNWLVLHPMEKL